MSTRRVTAAVAAALLLLLLPAAARAQQQQPQQQPAATGAQEPVELVVDVSGSMGDDDGAGTRKIDGAKLALLDYLGSVERGSPIGLRTYPDQQGGGCNSGVERIAIAPADPVGMSAAIRKLSPDGDTPTAEAMRAAAEDIKHHGRHGTLVIVSDGESTCDDPCKAAQEIADKGINLDAITVGFQISEEGRKQLECISDALGGRYLNSDQSDQLRDTLDRLSRPQLTVTLSGAAKRSIVAGGQAEAITATIVNDGEVEATNAIAQLALDYATAGVDVERPVTHLGNLAPHTSRSVTWTVRADASTAGRALPFTVVGRALNASGTGRASGVLDSVGIPDMRDAGEILKGRGGQIAILGDSYSAGEGADGYDAGTDTDHNGCHRSPQTYLAPLTDTTRIACSGAVTGDVLTANPSQVAPGAGPVPAQIDALEAAQKKQPARAVVMTLGGNDAGFPELAKSCVAGRKSCTDTVFTDIPFPQTESVPTKEFVDEHLGPTSHTLNALIETYKSVNRALNNKDVVNRRGGRLAPILVPAYVLPIPLQGRSCAPMGFYTTTLTTAVRGVGASRTTYLLSAAEIDFLVDFALRLNSVVESAVETARREHGVPIFFVPTTEMAFQPNHTVCDVSARLARATASFNGGAVNANNIIRLANPSLALNAAVDRFRAAKTMGERGLQELAHPNADGYAAETQAMLRWSQTRAAADAVAYTRTARPAEPQPTSWPASDVVLGPAADAGTLQAGTSYPLQAGGFAAGSNVRIEVRSTPQLLRVAPVDAAGRVATRVGLPADLPAGNHELRVLGMDPQGHARIVRVALRVDRGRHVTFVAGMGAGSLAACLLGGALLALSGRKRRRV